jgi:hypothetical protein
MAELDTRERQVINRRWSGYVKDLALLLVADLFLS